MFRTTPKRWASTWRKSSTAVFDLVPLGATVANDQQRAAADHAQHSGVGQRRLAAPWSGQRTPRGPGSPRAEDGGGRLPPVRPQLPKGLRAAGMRIRLHDQRAHPGLRVEADHSEHRRAGLVSQVLAGLGRWCPGSRGVRRPRHRSRGRSAAHRPRLSADRGETGLMGSRASSTTVTLIADGPPLGGRSSASTSAANCTPMALANCSSVSTSQTALARSPTVATSTNVQPAAARRCLSLASDSAPRLL